MSNAPSRSVRNPHIAAWWIAALAAVAAVIGALVVLRETGPSPRTLQAAHDRGISDAPIAAAAQSRQQTTARAAQVATTGRARTTERSAQAAAASVPAAIRDASDGP